MSLAEYDEKVKPHLKYIEAGAEMAARHARSLKIRPDFATKAAAQLQETREVLEHALAEIDAAQATYNSKPMEGAHA
jgi:hypothetical protein